MDDTSTPLTGRLKLYALHYHGLRSPLFPVKTHKGHGRLVPQIAALQLERGIHSDA